MDIKLELNRTISMLLAHPENTPNSEFSDRIDSLIEVREGLNEYKRDLLISYNKKVLGNRWDISKGMITRDIDNFLKNK